MLEALICRRCGAPLPPGAQGDVVTCAHCGTSSRITGAANHPVAVPVRGVSFALVGAAAVGVIVAFTTSVVLFLTPTESSSSYSVTTSSSYTTSTTSSTTSSSVAAAEAAPAPVPVPEPKGLPWTALETAEVGRWVVIEPPPPSTPPSDFAPNAHIEWAETIARAWSPDAVLVRMDLGGVRKDGGLDLVNDPHASLRYVTVSPIRRAAAAEIAKVSHEVPPSSLVVSIDEGKTSVMIGSHWKIAEGSTFPVRSPCTMAQILAAGGDDLSEKPDHEVRLDWREPYSGLPGWLFDVDGKFYVFPDDCTKWTLQAARRRQ